MNAKRLVGVNERGLRVGEDHQRAKLTDEDVERIRQMHEKERIGYRRLAAMFEVGKTTISDICNYRRRAQAAVRFRLV